MEKVFVLVISQYSEYSGLSGTGIPFSNEQDAIDKMNEDLALLRKDKKFLNEVVDGKDTVIFLSNKLEICYSISEEVVL